MTPPSDALYTSHLRRWALGFLALVEALFAWGIGSALADHYSGEDVMEASKVWVGWIGIAFFGLGSVLTVLLVFRRGANLICTSEGVAFRSGFIPPRTIARSDIEEIRVTSQIRRKGTSRWVSIFLTQQAREGKGSTQYPFARSQRGKHGDMLIGNLDVSETLHEVETRLREIWNQSR